MCILIQYANLNVEKIVFVVEKWAYLRCLCSVVVAILLVPQIRA